MAQQVVTELVIDSDVSGANQFSQAMDKASDSAQKATSSASDASLAIAGVGVGMIAAFAAISQGINYIVGLNKGLADLATMAKQVGLSLADIQGIQFGGQIAGLSTDQITAGLQKSAALLNDASRNANSLSKELEANGLSVKNANGQLISQNQLLAIAADLVKRAQNPGDAKAIAEMLGFTKEWIPLLEQGSGAMTGLTDEARSAGVVLSDDLIKRAAEFDTEWRKSSVTAGASLKAMLLDLLPFVDDLIQRAKQFVDTIKDGISKGESGRPSMAGNPFGARLDDSNVVDRTVRTGIRAALNSAGINPDNGIEIKLAPEVTQGWTNFTGMLQQKFNDVQASATDDMKKRIEDLDAWWHSKAMDPAFVANAVPRMLNMASSGAFPAEPVTVARTSAEDMKWSNGTGIQVTDTSAAQNTAMWNAEAEAAKKLSGEVVGLTNSFGEHSKVVAKDAKAANDAVDSAINTLTRHIERQKADAEAIGLGDGALAKFRAQAAETAAVQANGGKETAEQAAKFAQLKIDAFNAADALAKVKAASQIDFAQKTVFLSPQDVAIANQLKGIYGNDVPAALNSTYAAQLRTIEAQKQLKEAAEQFASGFVKDLANGVPALQALQNALKTLASSLIDSAVKKLVDQALTSVAGAIGGAASGASSATATAAILNTAGTTLAAQMVAGATEAAGILTGSGVTTGAAVGLGAADAAITLDLSGATTGAGVAAGGVVAGAALEAGGLTIAAALGPLALLIAALAAVGAIAFLGGGDDSAKKAAAQQAEQDRQAAMQREAQYTQRWYDARTRDAQTYQEAVAQQDHKFNQERLDENAKGGQAMDELLRAQVEERNRLTQDWATKQRAALEAERAALEAAAKAHQDYVSALYSDIYSAAGKGYINDIGAALQKRLENMSKATNSLEVDLTNLDFFTTAQNVIDGAKLTGSAFQELVTMFPILSNYVHEYSAALDASAVAAAAAAAATEKLSLQMRLLSATTDSSTLAGALTLFDAKAKQEYDAAVAAGSQNLTLLLQVQSAERQNIIDGFAKQAIAAEKQVADARLAQMQRIQQYLDNLTGGSSSTLSPRDRLDAARSQFQTQLSLAQGGDQNALSNITTYSDNFLSASRAYNASSQAFQNDLAFIQASLSSLMGAAGVSSTSVSSASVPGVSSVPTAANTNNNMSAMFAAQNAKMDTLTAEIVVLKTAVKDAVDANTRAVQAAHEAENEHLEKMDGNLNSLASQGNAALAAPR